jgi:hypothetical protein
MKERRSKGRMSSDSKTGQWTITLPALDETLDFVAAADEFSYLRPKATELLKLSINACYLMFGINGLMIVAGIICRLATISVEPLWVSIILGLPCAGMSIFGMLWFGAVWNSLHILKDALFIRKLTWT